MDRETTLRILKAHRTNLEDIHLSCQKIMRYTIGMAFDSFCKDDRTYDAVIRNLEIIGEAAKNIPSELQSCYPS